MTERTPSRPQVFTPVLAPSEQEARQRVPAVFLRDATPAAGPYLKMRLTESPAFQREVLPGRFTDRPLLSLERTTRQGEGLAGFYSPVKFPWQVS